MIHSAPSDFAPRGSGPGAQVAQLRRVLALVEEMAGGGCRGEGTLEDPNWIGSAYDAAPPIVRRRFDALAAETTEWATAAAEALIRRGTSEQGRPPRAAARCLAGELTVALRQLGALLD